MSVTDQLPEWMKVVARTYAGGDYSDLAESNHEALDLQLEHTGDTLFNFLMIELAPTEDCDSTAEALRRVEAAIRDLTNVAAALEQLQENEGADGA